MKGLFARQKVFQSKVSHKPLPIDSSPDFSYHMCLMIEELGELAKTDKRWRASDGLETKPSGNKLDEIADVFIVAMNLAMYSGYEYEDVVQAITNKISKNEGRLPK